MIKNSIGIEAHISDELIHWRETCRRPAKENEQLYMKVRAAWDAIVAAGQRENLEFLLDRARHVASLDECDAQAGESL